VSFGAGTWLALIKDPYLEDTMTWLFLATIVVAGFALLKVRRRRRARQRSAYSDAKAA
jgi:cytochrome oxidase assembly protein ShyY1